MVVATVDADLGRRCAGCARGAQSADSALVPGGGFGGNPAGRLCPWHREWAKCCTLLPDPQHTGCRRLVPAGRPDCPSKGGGWFRSVAGPGAATAIATWDAVLRRRHLGSWAAAVFRFPGQGHVAAGSIAR